MDAEDRRLFETSLRQAVARHTGPALDSALQELGWPDALAEDPAGAAAAMFAVQGETNAATGAIDDVLANALGRSDAGAVGVVLPPLGGQDPPGRVLGERLVIEGTGSRRLRDAPTIVAVVQRGEDVIAVALPRDAADLREVAGLDPLGGWVEVRADLAMPTTLDLPPRAWDAAVVAGRLAISQELTAAARAILTMARDHAAERVQFGRPIGSFQAVRHRLADALIAVESAEAAVAVGWQEPSTFTAAMAKAIAGRSARTVTRHAQQVLAGMGFTSEHAFHRYMKRTMVLDQLLGSSAAISAGIGRDVLTNRQLPSMLAL